MTYEERQAQKYFITNDQLEQLEHYKRMFEMQADIVNGLCSGEKDDVVYGFELGKLHSYQRDCFVEMMRLENEIRSQTIDEKEKTV